MNWLALSMLAGCGSPTVPVPTAVVEAQPESHGRAAEEAKPAKPDKGIPTPADQALRPMSIVGYGVELELRPPFQAMHARLAESTGHLIVTWWDVAFVGAGGHPVRGMYSIVLVPGESLDPSGTIEKIPSEDPRRQTVYRVGTNGTEVRLETPLQTLEQIGGALKRGPDVASWTLHDGEIVDFPGAELLQSADPATGHPYELTGKPTRPWGPWPPEEPPQ